MIKNTIESTTKTIAPATNANRPKWSMTTPLHIIPSEKPGVKAIEVMAESLAWFAGSASSRMRLVFPTAWAEAVVESAALGRIDGWLYGCGPPAFVQLITPRDFRLELSQINGVSKMTLQIEGVKIMVQIEGTDPKNPVIPFF